jgi:hypothetical protein
VHADDDVNAFDVTRLLSDYPLVGILRGVGAEMLHPLPFCPCLGLVGWTTPCGWWELDARGGDSVGWYYPRAEGSGRDKTGNKRA